MSIQLNHTIVHARDAKESATFLAEILGLPAPEPFYHFLVVRTGNGVSLDFLGTDELLTIEHYAFLVSEAEFDTIWERIRARGLTFWADPAMKLPNAINRHDGGRGLYFRDPSGHVLEIITRPYGKRRLTMDAEDFEGTLVLEKLAEIGQVNAFLEAVDSDDFAEATTLMRRAGVDPSTIAIVLRKMASSDGEH